MARLLSMPVLGGGALIASPALWAALVDGTMPLETALSRFAVAVVLAWIGVSVLGSLVEGTSPPARPSGPPSVDLAVRASVMDDDRPS
jgi:hypothetical protein